MVEKQEKRNERKIEKKREKREGVAKKRVENEEYIENEKLKKGEVNTIRNTKHEKREKIDILLN